MMKIKKSNLNPTVSGAISNRNNVVDGENVERVIIDCIGRLSKSTKNTLVFGVKRDCLSIGDNFYNPPTAVTVDYPRSR